LPTELSGGEQQRVAVARAIVNDPALVLADEPTGNLDTVATASVLGVLRRLHRQGRTLVVITHEHDVAAFANRVSRCVMQGHQRSAPRTRHPAGRRGPGGPNRMIRFDSIRIALGGIAANRLRSVLTMLGMLIVWPR